MDEICKFQNGCKVDRQLYNTVIWLSPPETNPLIIKSKTARNYVLPDVLQN